MKVTYNWLKEYVHFDLPVEELGKKITSAGPEVVAITPVGISAQSAGKIVLAKVLEVNDHPNSNKLKIVNLSAGKTPYSIVTNSQILEKGFYVLIALPGAVLSGGFEIKETEIRGVKSPGMLLGKENLGLEEKSNDVWVLGTNEKSAKTAFETYTQEDWVMEIELTANRSDCLSVIGIAREVAAVLEKELNIPRPSAQETLDEVPQITIQEKNLCPRYSGRILRDVQVMPSPDWMKRKLELCGIRSINNLVDVTNYVLLEYGHPMHAFDLSRLSGGKIVVRRAAANEKFKTLDSVEHKLDADTLVIADKDKAVAIAGVMGGENSEILDTTTDLLLEAAYFDPLSIRKTSKKLGIKTESSYRFERTADWGITTAALERATELILTTCTPKVSKIRDEFVNLFKDKIVTVKTDYVNEKLGLELSQKEIENILKRLKFSIVAKREDVLEAKVPSFRSDISRAIDVAEEIARIYGYNNIPATNFKPPIDAESLRPTTDIRDRLREALLGIGLTEAYHQSFLSDADIERCMLTGETIIRLQNPLSQDAALLRPRLFPGFLKTVEYNLKNAYRTEASLFELGRTFVQDKNSMVETRRLGIAFYGPNAGFFKLTGTLDYIMKRVGRAELDLRKANLPFLHPVNSAEILLNGVSIGFAGEIHPDISESMDLKLPLYMAEIAMDPLAAQLLVQHPLEPISKFPPTTRDLSLVVSMDVLARDIMHNLKTVSPLVQTIKFVDCFKGLQLGDNKKSLTFSIVFQSGEKTLTDTEVNAAMDLILARVKEKFSAELR